MGRLGLDAVERDRRRPAGRVAYLDGLRGWMAVAVVLQHFVIAFWPHQPITWLGHSAVYVFFLLSGHVLAPMALRSRLSLAAQLARRLVRLGLPILAALLLSRALWSLGLARTHEFLLAHPGLSGATMPAFRGEEPASLVSVFTEAVTMIWQRPNSVYDYALWTMSFEYVGSFLTFIVYALRPPRPIRLVLCAAALLLLGKPELKMFFVGALAADLEFARLAGRLPASLRSATVAALLVAAAFCCQYTGFKSLDTVDLHYVGASCLFLAVLWAPAMQEVLGAPVSAFLGRVSFAMYLLHEIVLCSAGVMLLNLLADGSASGFAQLVAVSAPFATIVLAAAWVFTRCVDEPAIRLSHLAGQVTDRLWRGTDHANG